MAAGGPKAEEERVALFISHASPEDNTFTVWLGAKLSALGYDAWADVLRLRGGDDWQRKLEHALRHRTRKVLLVANAAAVEKQGVRNEIQIASTVGRTMNDAEFIIPLRLAPFDAPFLIAHAQYIDFQRGWARGLAELLETLEETYKVPRQPGDGSAIWRDIHLIHAKSVVDRPERLVSNWLSIKRLPPLIRLFDFKGGISIGQAQARMKDAPWPIVPYRRGFLSLAPSFDLQDHFGPNLPLETVAECPLDAFLDDGWEQQDIERWDARNQFSNLARQALERRFRERGLSGYALSDRQTAWWAPVDTGPTNKVSFRWADISGLRQIQGVSVKRRMNWHFGVSVAARTGPIRHVRVIGRLIFTTDGQTPFKDPGRMHRLRRSFAKSWRNARWRDMLLAFLYWLADGNDELIVSTSSIDSMVLRLPPITWISPVSMPVETEAEEADDDDPSDDEEIDPQEFEEPEDNIEDPSDDDA
jgi:hypothetical protein